jgi:hypothetical protein
VRNQAQNMQKSFFIMLLQLLFPLPPTRRAEANRKETGIHPFHAGYSTENLLRHCVRTILPSGKIILKPGE